MEKSTGFWREFKAFIARGNVMDMAVGVIIGGAFSNITNSLINDIIMPILGIFTNSLSFADLAVKIGPGNITYGNFIQAVLNFRGFFIWGFWAGVYLSLSKHITASPPKRGPPPPPPPPGPSPEEKLLAEIRDLLKERA